MEGDRPENLTKAQQLIDAMATWNLAFKTPLSRISLHSATPCVLQPMVIWYDLNRFGFDHEAGSGERFTGVDYPWVLGSSIFSGGINASLGELERGEITARYCVRFLVEDREHGWARHIALRGDLTAGLLHRLRAMQREIVDGGRPDSASVSLAVWQKNGTLAEKGLKYRAALAAARGVSFKDISTANALEYLKRDMANKRESLKRGSMASLVLYNERGELLGSERVRVAQS